MRDGTARARRRRLLGHLIVLLAISAGLSSCGDPGASSTRESGGHKARHTGEERPDALSGWLSGIADCMRGRGWDVQVTPDGTGITEDTLQPAQQPSFSADFTECEGLVGPLPTTEPMNAKRAEQIYEQLLETRSCLELLGYPMSTPPPVDSFVDDYLGGDAPWHPYTELPRDLGMHQWRSAEAACPQPG